MKLRNKKTGEIGEPRVDYQEIYVDTTEHKTYCYKSIAELNEDWEDYKPVEPLIKDPKIRKAVRAWAEANETRSVVARKDFTYFEYEGYRIEFPTTSPSDFIAFYTIAELCGEEEE